MLTISTTNSSSFAAFDDPSGSHKYTFALVNDSDFARARRIIDDFSRWNSYEDFICERDGYYIGLSTSGCAVRQVEVRLSDFLEWSRHAGIAPSLESLDRFGAQIDDYRANPAARVIGVPTSAWSPRGASERDADHALVLPIAPELYLKWLASAARAPMRAPIPSLDLYARDLLETWTKPMTSGVSRRSDTTQSRLASI